MAPSLKNRRPQDSEKPYQKPHRICGCLAQCRGRQIPVSDRTYRRHRAFRDQMHPFSAEFQAFLEGTDRLNRGADTALENPYVQQQSNIDEGSDVNIDSCSPALASPTPTRDTRLEAELSLENTNATSDGGSTVTEPNNANANSLNFSNPSISQQSLTLPPSGAANTNVNASLVTNFSAPDTSQKPLTLPSSGAAALGSSKNPLPPNQTRELKAGKKATKFRPGLAHTPRNVCGREWLNANPGGSKDDFNEYFSNLSPEQKKVYEIEAKRLKTV